MSLGNRIVDIRKEKQLTQEEFGQLFYVTRQTVSNWENGKSYPELQILVNISNQFDISLDTLIKGDSQMVKAIDREIAIAKMKHENHSLILLPGQAQVSLYPAYFHPVHGEEQR